MWNRTTWGAVSDLKYGKALRGYSADGGAVEVFGTNGPIGWTGESLTNGPRPIVGRKGAYRGVHLARGPFWVIDTAYWLEPSGELDPIFAYYNLLTVDINGMDSGSAIPSLTKSHFVSMPLFLPPLDEQRRIVEVLGALDDLIDTNEQLKSDLDELARATFLRAWDGESWMTVAELGEVIMGQSPPGDTYSETPVGVPFHQGVRDFGARFPTSRIYCSAPTRIAEAGDILIAVRAPVGEMNVAPERIAIGRGLAALRATRPSTALQAIRAFESTWSAHQGTGTVFSSINGRDLRAAKVPLVDDETVEAALWELDHAYAGLHHEGAELRRMRDELLPLLMSGAVRVRPEGVAA
jgi:type I restriction enzyme S subunit